MDPFVDSLNEQIAYLQDDIRRNPDRRYLRLEKLMELRALYSDETAPTAAASSRPLPAAEGNSNRYDLRKRADASSVRERAIEFIKYMLSDTTDPVKTADLYDLLIEYGIQIGGKEPKSNLSAMLYNSGLFQSHGRAGWTLLTHEEVEEKKKVLQNLTLDDLTEPDVELGGEYSILKEGQSV